MVVAFIAVFVGHAFVIQPYKVDGTSMEPTLSQNDRLLVFKLGRSWSKITKKQYIPKRGEIIVFQKPNHSDMLIKRVIALPNERITIKNRQIIVYNNQQSQGFEPQFNYIEPVLSPSATENIDIVLGSDEIFVIGDNRFPGASHDSRSSLGPIKLDLIVGSLVIRLLPINHFHWF